MKILSKCELFSNIPTDEISTIFNHLHLSQLSFNNGETIFNQQQTIDSIGFILKGSVQIIQEDYWGNRCIIANLGQNDIFGEIYALTSDTLDVNVIACNTTQIIFIKISELLNIKNSLLQSNLLKIFAQKNRVLSKKIDILSKRSTSEKILAYLSSLAIKHNSNSFTIPFNRQELADFLCVNRSALSIELSKLQENKIITYTKNEFTLLKHDEYKR